MVLSNTECHILKTFPLWWDGHHPKTDTLNMLKWFRFLLCVPLKHHKNNIWKSGWLLLIYHHFKLTPYILLDFISPQKGYDSLQENVWPLQCHLSPTKQGLIWKFLRDNDGLQNRLLGGSPNLANGCLRELPPATCNQTNPTQRTY